MHAVCRVFAFVYVVWEIDYFVDFLEIEFFVLLFFGAQWGLLLGCWCLEFKDFSGEGGASDGWKVILCIYLHVTYAYK